jgi:hypothetical protein
LGPRCPGRHLTVDILGIPGDVDPIVAHLAQERRQALLELRERLRVVSDFELAPYWRQLLGHWRSELVGAHDAAIEAQFVAFHEVVAGMGAPAVLVEGGGQQTKMLAGRGQILGRSFLGIDDVQKVLDFSSFLTRNTASISTHSLPLHRSATLANGTSRRGSPDAFAAPWKASSRSWAQRGSPPYGRSKEPMREFKRGSRRMYREWIGADALDGMQRIYACGVAVGRTSTQKPRRLRRHVPQRRSRRRSTGMSSADMLDAVKPALEVEDRDLTPTSLRTLLKLNSSRYRDPSTAPEPLVSSAGLLRGDTVALALHRGPALLSIFADRAWDFVFDDWRPRNMKTGRGSA